MTPSSTAAPSRDYGDPSSRKTSRHGHTEYDAGGLPASVSFDGAPIIASVSYDALGRAVLVRWGNGTQTHAVYAPNEKVEHIEVTRTTPYAQLTKLRYEFDATGNVSAMFEDAALPSWSRSFTYDWADRLTSATHTEPGRNASWSWTYAPNGNMTFNSEWNAGGMDGTYTYQGAGPHAVTRIGGPSGFDLTYDLNGSMTSEGGVRTYSYDFDGRQKTLSDSSMSPNPNATFTYDANADRARKQWTAADGSHDLRYFGPHLEKHIVGSTTFHERYVLLGSARIAFKTDFAPTKTYFLHPDVQGTIGLITDETGEVVQRRVYKPYGGPFIEEGSEPGVRYGYTGQEHDKESTQIHLGVRQLNFTIARFIVPDVIVPDPFRPQSLNRYTYALNNPLRYTDPSGYASRQANGCSIQDSCTDGEATIWDKAQGKWVTAREAIGSAVQRMTEAAISGGDAAELTPAGRQAVGAEDWSNTDQQEAMRGWNGGASAASTYGDVTGKGAEVGLEAGKEFGFWKGMSKLFGGFAGVIKKKPPAVRIRGTVWKKLEPGTAACASGCDEAAAAIQKALGGEIKTLRPTLGRYLGFVRNSKGHFVNPAADADGWFYHKVVVRDGRVYDVMTGPAGMPAAEYKALWLHADKINFGF